MSAASRCAIDLYYANWHFDCVIIVDDDYDDNDYDVVVQMKLPQSAIFYYVHIRKQLPSFKCF